MGEPVPGVQETFEGRHLCSAVQHGRGEVLMVDTEKTPTQKPCARGCTYKPMIDGEAPKPRPTKHGNYCNRCYYNTDNALAQLGSLVEHIISMVGQKGGRDDESQKLKGQPPLPFNVEAFNDANEMYSRLIYWGRILAGILNIPAPAPAEHAWADMTGSIRGLPADVAPGTARLQVQAVAEWLRARLDDICGIEGDDIDFFHDEWKDVYRLAAKWPMRAKPRYSDMPCPISDCGARLAVFPPNELGDDEKIVCDTGHHIPPDKYEFYIRFYQEAQREKRSAEKVTRHLERKYG